MVDRANHYEASLEAWLRRRHLPYVAVDESRRSVWSDPHQGPSSTLKSLDFIISPPGKTWLVDVKGRRFPAGRAGQYWRNWSTLDDLRSLARWESLFGLKGHGLFVFAYLLAGSRSPLPESELWEFRRARYGFVAITLRDYLAWSRPISPKWDTWALPTRAFRQLAVPLGEWLS